MSGDKVAVLWMMVWSSILLLDGLLPKSVMATHDVNHRFIVYGYVRDDHGQPITNEKVIVVDTRIDEGMTTFTDRDGYYESLLHLHDDDLGDEIVVMVKDQRKSIHATFDPSDKHTERKAEVSFGSAAAAGKPQTPILGYGLAALVVVGVALAIGAIRYRRRGSKQPRKDQKKRN